MSNMPSRMPKLCQPATSRMAAAVVRWFRPASPSSGHLRQLCCVFAVGCSLQLPAWGGENWTSFQNAGEVSFGSGSSAGNPSDKPAAQWEVEIPGYGQSSPVVWNGRVYVTSVSGESKDRYHVSAYTVADGTKLWQHDLTNASPQESSGYVSKAAPTPAADDSGLICFFEGGNLVALTHDGSVRWERNLVEEYGEIDARHGIAASVEQSSRAAFVWVERQSDPYVLAIDKQTGETLWKVPGLGTTSWASPRLVPVKGGRHLVLSGVGKLAGLDPTSGERRWLYEAIAGNSTPTPVPLGEGRFLVGATVGRGGSDAGGASDSNCLLTVRPQPDGSWMASRSWKAERATSSFGSPIRHGEYAYFVNRSGVLYCVDAESGEEQYAQRVGSSVWATPIGDAERLWLFGKDGVVKSVLAGEEFRVMSETSLFPAEAVASTEAGRQGPPTASGPILYAGILVGDLMVLRSGDRLYCFRR